MLLGVAMNGIVGPVEITGPRAGEKGANTRVAVVAVLLQAASEISQRGLEVALGIIHPGAVAVGGGIPRISLDRLGKVGEGALEVGKIKLRHAAVTVSQGKLGIAL